MKGMTFCLAIAVAILQTAQVQADTWYFQGLVGKRFLTDADLTLQGSTSNVEISTDGVPSGSAAVGYRIRSFPYQAVNTRIEIQAGASESEPDTLEARGALATQVGTTQPVDFDAENLHSFYSMINLWVDYDLGESWVVSAGGGLGAAYIRWDHARAGMLTFDDSDIVFAYQGGMGLGYKLFPDFVVSLDYRYFATSDVELGVNDQLSAEYGAHDLMFGLRYFF